MLDTWLYKQSNAIDLAEDQRFVMHRILDNKAVAIRGSGVYPITYVLLAEVSDVGITVRVPFV